MEHLEEVKSFEEQLMCLEIDMVKSLLTLCSMDCGAKIIITVEHDNGNKVSAHLYDHAALVQGLYDALNYFQSEI